MGDEMRCPGHDRGRLAIPEVTYRGAKTEQENLEKVDWAYDVLFEEVLKGGLSEDDGKEGL